MTKEHNQKKQLGRGLSALLGDVRSPLAANTAGTPSAAGPAAAAGGAAPAARGGARALPVAQIVPGSYQPRRDFDEADFAELVASIKAQGVLQPILVRRHPEDATKYEIIAGERRWRAAQAAQLHEIPALVRDLTDREALEAALVENLQRQDLNAIEEAIAYRRLMDEFGYTQEQVAQGLGKSRPYIANIVRLLDLPAEVQALVRDGKLSAGHARLLVGLPDAASVAARIVAQGLSVRQAEALVNALKATPASSKPDGRARDQANADTRALERSLTEALGLKVQIQAGKSGKSGTLSIHYQTLDQLDELLAKLTGAPKI
ncbi:MAG TPA: ParB/RepB/Spo0J family partition protein [Alphaproteobacteria bacterium]